MTNWLWPNASLVHKKPSLEHAEWIVYIKLLISLCWCRFLDTNTIRTSIIQKVLQENKQNDKKKLITPKSGLIISTIKEKGLK